jgi:uncharacterized RDD family membrane protein YckC
VATPSNFAASPGKRHAAFLVDSLVVLLSFMFLAAAGEMRGQDIARWDVLAAIYYLYQSAFLAARQGATLGRYAQSIAVVSESGAQLSLLRSLIRTAPRALPLALIEYHPETSLIGSLTLLFLVVAETRLIERSPSRQSFCDRTAGCLVVNLPPPRTHRAPAGPMYSSTDQEFGTPPKRRP